MQTVQATAEEQALGYKFRVERRSNAHPEWRSHYVARVQANAESMLAECVGSVRPHAQRRFNIEFRLVALVNEYQGSPECLALQASIDAAMKQEQEAAKPCPDLLIHFAELWNACEFATTAEELAEIGAEFAMIACTPVNPLAMAWTFGGRYEYANGLEVAALYVDGARAILWDFTAGGYVVATGYEDAPVWAWTLDDEETHYSTFADARAAMASA